MEKRIGLFGGTFNPPHIGHIRAAEHFAKSADLSLLYVMPSSIPPHKRIDAADTPAHRFNMAKRAFSGVDCPTVVSALELMRDGKSYSIDTVNTLLSANNVKKVYMYVGSDMLFCFTRWKDYDELFRKCILVTTARNDEDREQILSVCEEYKKQYGCEYILMDYAPLEISSTDIRDYFANNKQNSAKNYLTESVYEYIIKGRLFTQKKVAENGEVSLQKIRQDLVDFVDEKRLSHILSVEKEAVCMAELLFPAYGIENDVYEVSQAALLHDITKCKDHAWHTQYLSQFEVERADSEPVEHSWSSAYFALEHYNVSPQVFKAIYNHTTGRADMSLIEKIIYLADFIEPTREHSVCRKLREFFYDGIAKAQGDFDKIRAALEKTLVLSFEMTEKHLRKKGQKVSPELYEALDFLRKNTQK